MSFFSGNCQGCIPGPIMGNPLNGLCEKACIETNKIFDACMKQIQETGAQININTYVPKCPAFPLTFVSCSCYDEPTVENLVIDRFEDKPCFARVTATISIPVSVNYTDANGVSSVGKGSIVVNEDVVLYVPQPSIFPYKIEALASCVCADGEFIGNDVFSVDICITIITKVLANVDILVPSYGYCQVPACQEYTQDVCSGFFDLPLYPQAQPVKCPTVCKTTC